MADNASLARPYAKAVFSLAQETNTLDAWASVLGRLSAVSQDSEFAALVADPKMDSDKVTDLLTELAGSGLPDGGNNFINLLVANSRVGALADIEHQYTALVAESKAQVNAEVVTAMALTDAQKDQLASALQSRLGMSVNLLETVDASLTGGASIKAGELVSDGSAKGRLEKLTSALRR